MQSHTGALSLYWDQVSTIDGKNYNRLIVAVKRLVIR